jgi:hypothetical protein
MAIDTEPLTQVLQLAQICEDVARAALGIAQDQLRTKLITQDVFDQAFQDYGLAMQKARDMYYQASHSLAQQIIHAADLKTLTDQTTELKASLARLTRTEHILAISFGVVTLAATIATAVTAPGEAALRAAVTAGTALKTTITG